METSITATVQEGCSVTGTIDEAKLTAYLAQNPPYYQSEYLVDFSLEEGMFTYQIGPEWEDRVYIDQFDMESTTGIPVEAYEPWGRLALKNVTTVDKSTTTTLSITDKAYFDGLCFTKTDADSGALDANGTTIKAMQMYSYKFGADLSGKIPDNFMAYCTNLETWDFPTGNEGDTINITITEIGNKFFYNCTSLTKALRIKSANLTKIGDDCLNGCSSMAFFTIDESTYNVYFGDKIISIGNNFIRGCSALIGQGLALEVASGCVIGNSFMHGCTGITFAPSMTAANIEEVGNDFMYGCTSYHGYNASEASTGANISIPFKKVGARFLGGCTAFGPLDGSTHQFKFSMSYLEEAGIAFLGGCTSFNMTIDLPKLKTIPDSFLSNCSGFNKPILAPLVMGSLGSSYLTGCSSYNLPIAFPLCTSIGGRFLNGCGNFNSKISLPNLTQIGDYFLYNCTSYNQNLELSPYLTSIGSWIMYNCKAMTSYINVGDLSADIGPTESLQAPVNFITQDSSAPCYTTGIGIKGANRTAWLNKYTLHSTGNRYRKLVDAGA